MRDFFICGNSSVGRAQPCQGWGREFESRFPLQFYNPPTWWIIFLAGWQSGHAAVCKTADAGSIPTPASSCKIVCPGGETGRRKGLKIPRSENGRAGSIPAPGTNGVVE